MPRQNRLSGDMKKRVMIGAFMEWPHFRTSDKTPAKSPLNKNTAALSQKNGMLKRRDKWPRRYNNSTDMFSFFLDPLISINQPEF